MKKMACLALFSLWLFSGLVWTAEHTRGPDFRMGVSVTPLTLFGGFWGRFESILDSHMSLVFPVEAWYASWGMPTKYIRGGVGVRFHLSNPVGLNNWYVEPAALAGYSAVGNTGYLTLKPQVILGYSWVWASGFMLNLGLGPAFEFYLLNKIHAWPFGYLTGEFAIGYLF